jgi:hypothetical protein
MSKRYTERMDLMIGRQYEPRMREAEQSGTGKILSAKRGRA